MVRWSGALIGLLVWASGEAAGQVPPAYPRLANMYWNTEVDSTILQALARWDVAVVNTSWTADQIQALRDRNPDIRLFAIVNLYAVRTPSSVPDPFVEALYAYASTHDLWWYDADARVASDWPGSGMANITGRAPVGPEGHWILFVVDQIDSLLRARPALDGVFLDNFWERISWQQVWRQLDSDCNPTWNPAGCDGIPDDPELLDAMWNASLRAFAYLLRRRFDALEADRGRPLAILSNNATDYFEYLNGTMLEFFPSAHNNVDYDNPYGYNWYEEMFGCPGGYLVAPFRAAPFQVRVLNGDYPGSTWTPARNSSYERIKRFVLGSALLGDGYMSLDSGVQGHGNLWWEPEYDHGGRGTGYLGGALSGPYRVRRAQGPEMLTNSGFEAGMPPWKGYGFGATGSVGLDGGEVGPVPPALRIDVDRVDDPSGHYKIWQAPLQLQHHQAYTLSFWARASTPQTLTVHVYAEDCPGLRCWNDHRFCVSTTWTHHEISFAANATTTAAGLNFFVGAPGTLWLDDVSLRPGDSGVFRRDFENGIVLLNYTAATQEIALGDTLYHLSLPGSPIADGRAVTVETIPSTDARILLYDPPAALPPGTATDTPPRDGIGLRLVGTPNPFNPRTRLRYHVPREGPVRLTVFDVAGHRVRQLRAVTRHGAGWHTIEWDGRDDHGRAVASGIYIARLTTADGRQQRKLVLAR